MKIIEKFNKTCEFLAYTIYKVVFGFCFLEKLTPAQETGGQVSLSCKER